MQKSIPLLAGVETRISALCKTMLLKSTGVATSIDMQVEFAGTSQPEDFGSVERGFSFRSNEPVQNLLLKAPVDCTVVVVTSTHLIDLNFVDGAKLTATIDPAQLPLQTQNDKGDIGNPVYVAGLTYNDAPAVSGLDNAAIAITSGGQSLLTANAARKSARFTNLGPNPVTIGFTGHTWAKRALVLSQGDTWLEDRAANLAWVAITDAGQTASVTVQEVRT